MLVHAADDTSVPVENSLLMYDALRKARVRSELHVFDSGGHGFGLRSVAGKDVAAWPTLVQNWATNQCDTLNSSIAAARLLGVGAASLGLAAMAPLARAAAAAPVVRTTAGRVRGTRRRRPAGIPRHPLRRRYRAAALHAAGGARAVARSRRRHAPSARRAGSRARNRISPKTACSST